MLRYFLVLGAVVFFAPSAYAKLLPRECGPYYGGVSFVFNEGVGAIQLAERFRNLPWAREVYDAGIAPDSRRASLYARLKSAKIYGYAKGASEVDVPIGSEEFIASQLAQTHLVHDLGLPWGDCGGAEIAYFSFGQLKDQDTLKEASFFENVIERAAEDFIKSKEIRGISTAGSIEMKAFTTFPIEPHLPLGRVRFRVASEISRDQRHNPTWDQFDVVFNLWRLSSKGSLVTVSTEQYKFAPRAGRSDPPSGEFFRSDENSDHWDTELIITGKIAAFFAKYFQGDCVMEGEGFAKGDRGYPPSCQNAPEEVPN